VNRLKTCQVHLGSSGLSSAALNLRTEKLEPLLQYSPIQDLATSLLPHNPPQKLKTLTKLVRSQFVFGRNTV